MLISAGKIASLSNGNLNMYDIKADYKEIINIFSFWDKDMLFLEEQGYNDFVSDLRKVFDKYKDLYDEAVKISNKLG